MFINKRKKMRMMNIRSQKGETAMCSSKNLKQKTGYFEQQLAKKFDNLSTLDKFLANHSI
jgi:hypothetical protein